MFLPTKVIFSYKHDVDVNSNCSILLDDEWLIALPEGTEGGKLKKVTLLSLTNVDICNGP